MNINQPTIVNRTAKRLAPLLSKLLMGNKRLLLTRKAIAYANILIGKGAGTGWDLGSEIKAAQRVILREQPVIFDVGGNIGDWSRWLRQKVPGGHIYIFEPQPGCQEKIREDAIANTTLIPAAAGEENTETELYSAPITDGTASLHRRKDSYFKNIDYRTLKVRVIRLDDFIAEHNFAFVDFVKMDIEGHELFALKGMATALAAAKIGALSFEFGSSNLNLRTQFGDFWELLTAKYSLYRITPAGRLILVSAYYEDMEFYRGATNYLAVLKEHPFGGRLNLSSISE